jgi:hypothetical protein
MNYISGGILRVDEFITHRSIQGFIQHADRRGEDFSLSKGNATEKFEPLQTVKSWSENFDLKIKLIS